MLKRSISEEQLHYESLTKLFKFALGMFSIFGLGVGFFIYSDGKEMRENFREERRGLKENIAEMKSELNETKAKMNRLTEDLINNTNVTIDNTKIKALGQIASIKDSATSIARKEANNSVNKVLNDNNFDEFVAGVAKQRMEPQINLLVDTKIADVNNRQIQLAISDIQSNDQMKVIKGLYTLQLNPQIELTDEQLSQIINVIKKSSNALLKLNLNSVLLIRKSNLTSRYFENELISENTPGVVREYAYHYFIINNTDDEIFTSFILSSMKKSSNPESEYFHVINLATSLNPEFIVRVLNDRRLTNYLLDSITKERLLTNRETLLSSLKKVIKEENLKQTYFFTK